MRISSGKPAWHTWRVLSSKTNNIILQRAQTSIQLISFFIVSWYCACGETLLFWNTVEIGKKGPGYYFLLFLLFVFFLFFYTGGNRRYSRGREPTTRFSDHFTGSAGVLTDRGVTSSRREWRRHGEIRFVLARPASGTCASWSSRDDTTVLLALALPAESQTKSIHPRRSDGGAGG